MTINVIYVISKIVLFLLTLGLRLNAQSFRSRLLEKTLSLLKKQLLPQTVFVNTLTIRVGRYEVQVAIVHSVRIVQLQQQLQ